LVAVLLVTCVKEPTAPPATYLTFRDQPAHSIAGSLMPPVRVAARDADGKIATSFTGEVTLEIGTNPAGGTLTGTLTVAAVQGIAAFSDLRIDRAGAGYRFTATSGDFPPVTSSRFDVLGGAPVGLSFTVAPGTVRAGNVFSPVVQVTAVDALGNRSDAFAGDITVSITGGTGTPGAGLLGSTTVTASSGVASFTTLGVDSVGTGYTLTATAPAIGVVASAPFDVIPGVAAQLVFIAQPSNATAGDAIAPAVVAVARDAQGNQATGFTGNVTVEITAGSGAPGANLLGTRTVAAVDGVATFSTLAVNRNGTGYTLSVRATGLTGAVSTAFDIAAGPVSQLAFAAQPQTSLAGAMLPPVVVVARDSMGNTVPGFTDAVTLSISVNPGGGALSGTTTVIAVQGVATFADLSIDRTGTGYRLDATADVFIRQSNAFSINPSAATRLGFTVEPASTPAGAAMTPSVRVAALDALGNVVTGFVGSITVAIGTNPVGGVLSGITTVPAANGVAIFAGLSIDRSGSGYTLVATATGVTGATSAAFDIFASSATQLAFTVQPSDAVAGLAIAPAVVVTARDAQGNTATDFTGNITVEITSGTGTPGANLFGTRTIAASGGVASFSTLSINRSGSGYTLSARASGLTGAVSTTFTIAAGAATQLVFTSQPQTSVAGATLPPVVVTAQDSMGNTVPSFTSSVTLTIGVNPGGGTLSGTRTMAAVAGVATFTTLSIDKVGSGYRLDATAGAFTRQSGAFSITPATATRLAFTVQPTTTSAGASISPSVRVAAQDAFGNTATSFTGNITVAITPGSGTAGAILSGTTTVPASAGVSIFSGLSIDRAGTGYTLRATATGLTQATSAGFDISSSSATQLAFTAQPTTEAAGAVITPAIQVTARDAQGNPATGYIGNITLTITGATLSGTRTVAAVAGVATFSTLSIDRSGTGYTLTATASGLTGTVSAAFTITAGAASRLVFTAQPNTSPAGVAISPPVQVTAEDGFGNTVTSFTGNVTVAITPGTGPATAVLSGTKTVAAVAGVASFSTLSIDTVNTGYRLTATAGGLAPDTSNAFTITPGTATRLGFTVQPTTTEAGSSISPSVRVAAQDAFGNTATSFAGNVTVAITPGSGTAGAILSGTTTVPASAGISIFSGLSIDRTGTGYTLRATATGLTQATSAGFDITSSGATQLAFTAQPTNEAAGAVITPAIQVTARDAQGNPATGYIGNITLTITGGTGTPGATLSGTRTVGAVAGVATFSTLSIDRSGTGYTLTATASGLTGTVSAAFNITAGAASRLVFTAQPNTSPAGVAISPPVQVTAEDALGNTATSFTGNVTVAITPGTGPATAVLSGTKTVAAVAGVASFSTLSIDTVNTGYRLTATAGALAPDTSSAFSITPGTATRLAFTVQPTTTTAGASISPSVRVAAQDAFGNTATSFAGNITVAITPGTGTAGAILSGTTTVPASAGISIFSGLSIDRAGTAYALRATSGALTLATSTGFDITSSGATHLVVTVPPSTTAAGATITPAIQVTARDAQGNTATTFINNVTVAITGGTGTPGATLSGTKTVAAVAGVATFSTLSIDRSGTGYTLTFTASGVTDVVSAPFTINPGAAARLVYTVQPTTSVAGAAIAPPVQVTARDALGNTATSFTGNVTVAITPGTGPAPAVLSGTKTVAAVAGVASFSTLSIDTVNTGYRLTATAGALPPDTSNAFSITPGAATQVGFTVQPTTTTAGASISPSVRVAAQDAFGNTATGFAGNITVAITPGSGTAGAILSGTTTVAASAGISIFSGLSIDRAGTAYTLRATALSLGQATSTAFDITSSGATHLVVTVPPSTTTAGATITPAIQVTARDAFGNTATTFINNVTVAITGGTGTPGATLSGTKTVAAVTGVATFSTLSIDRSGTGYTLTFTASGVTAVVSAPFTINPGAASVLVFTVQPTTGPAGVAISPPVQVTARDAFGNVATGFTGNVTMVISANPSGGTLTGTPTVTAVAGVATFGNLIISAPGVGYRLDATSAPLPSVTSNAFSMQ
jgi:hypothetical protein